MSESLILFDPFETLGSEVAASRSRRLADFEVYPSAQRLLTSLGRRAVLGVLAFVPRVSDARLRTLLGARNLIPPLAPELVAVARENEANPFERILRRARVGPERAVFVSLEAVLRARALDAGLRVAPHPALAAAALAGEPLRLVRLFARESGSRPDWASLLSELDVAPVLREDEQLYAIASRSALDALARSVTIGIEAVAESDLVARSTLCLFRMPTDPADAASELPDYVDRLASGGLPPLQPTPTTFLFALSSDRSLEDVHPPPALARHGHTRVLQPDPSVSKRGEQLQVGEPRPLDGGELAQLAKLDGASFRTRLEALCRVATSRHVDHPGNDAAVAHLKKALKKICKRAQLQGRYDNVWAEIEGQTNEIVVVGAHFDSTAGNGRGYRPKTFDAPGADDDGSGVAGVLEVARVLAKLADGKKPRRTIRFVLFNAEEEGMEGSEAYASYLKNTEKAQVVEMLAMDMIGWHKNGAVLTFEIHRGTDHVEARAESGRLAERLRAAAETVSPHLKAQVSRVDGTDPASGRSDHSSFHYRWWPACLLSEDVFAGSAAVGNPHYHMATDTPDRIKFEYAADITRVVAAVAWMDANN